MRRLAPFFERLPGAFTPLMGDLVRGYAATCRELGLTPDAEMLGPIMAMLGKLGGEGEAPGDAAAPDG